MSVSRSFLPTGRVSLPSTAFASSYAAAATVSLAASSECSSVSMLPFCASRSSTTRVSAAICASRRRRSEAACSCTCRSMMRTVSSSERCRCASNCSACIFMSPSSSSSFSPSSMPWWRPRSKASLATRARSSWYRRSRTASSSMSSCRISRSSDAACARSSSIICCQCSLAAFICRRRSSIWPSLVRNSSMMARISSPSVTTFASSSLRRARSSCSASSVDASFASFVDSCTSATCSCCFASRVSLSLISSRRFTVARWRPTSSRSASTRVSFAWFDSICWSRSIFVSPELAMVALRSSVSCCAVLAKRSALACSCLLRSSSELSVSSRFARSALSWSVCSMSVRRL
mmetsp:Transcript_38055/g.117586  ORF Transcript_38055/g.117586 Transcript_38055/m.117586 type:complete len:348 (-) Transcript_38055:462-1505(-)